MKTTATPITNFGRDHWSTFAFIETICVDTGGRMTDKLRRNMRTNLSTHPLLGYWPGGTDGHAWKKDYGTRLLEGQLPNHDDWDVADDLEAAGLIENIGTGMNPIYKMTPLGSKICGELRAFKAQGGSFAKFRFKAAAET